MNNQVPGSFLFTASPAPSAEEAAAISAAVQAVLDAERARVPHDPLPAVYRSEWRQAALVDVLREPTGGVRVS